MYSHTELDMHSDNDCSTFGDLCDPPIAQQSTSSPKHTSVETVVYKRAGNLDLLADIYLPQEVTTEKRSIGKDLRSDPTNHFY